jgi:hypothetical protein
MQSNDAKIIVELQYYDWQIEMLSARKSIL